MLIALIGFVLAKSATEWAEEVDAACKGVGSKIELRWLPLVPKMSQLMKLPSPLTTNASSTHALHLSFPRSSLVLPSLPAAVVPSSCTRRDNPANEMHDCYVSFISSLLHM